MTTILMFYYCFAVRCHKNVTLSKVTTPKETSECFGTILGHSILAWRTPWTGAWWTTLHGVMKSWTGLSDWHFPLISCAVTVFFFFPSFPGVAVGALVTCPQQSLFLNTLKSLPEFVFPPRADIEIKTWMEVFCSFFENFGNRGVGVWVWIY